VRTPSSDRGTALLERVRSDFGIALVGARPVGSGADARADLVRAVAADGSAYAVKTSTAAQSGLAVADHLAAAGVPGVPAPVRALDGSLTTTRDGVRLSVVPWVGDRRALDDGLTARQWRELGRVLRAVHAVDPCAAGLGDLPRAGHDAAGFAAAARALPQRLARADGGDPLVRGWAELWDRHGQRVLAVCELAERTGAADVWDTARLAVCHADAHHGNVVLGEDGGVWLVDWDDAVLAPVETDLVFVVGGVLATPTAPEQAAFAEGYGAHPVRAADPVRLAFAQASRALDDLTSFAADVLDVGLPETERAWALDVLRGQLGPEGLVAHALGER
jgi:spectinomycin phosphotransferase